MNSTMCIQTSKRPVPLGRQAMKPRGEFKSSIEEINETNSMKVGFLTPDNNTKNDKFDHLHGEINNTKHKGTYQCSLDVT